MITIKNMNTHSHTGFSFAGKLILLFIILLCISSLLIGFTGYSIAKNELNKRGEQILKNSVFQALDLIMAEASKVESGISTIEESQEHIKEVLLGPKDMETGLRQLNQKIDLGMHGYFIIYDSAGYEILHPSLEGENVLNVTDLNDNTRFLVKEQIDAGKNGGGFVFYSWWLPHSEKISRKISYCNYYAPWDWIVVATAYEIDFNKAANIILLVIVITIIVLIALVSLIIIAYIRKVTTPIVAIANGMGKVSKHEFTPVEKTYDKDEIALLTDGYNQMIHSLIKAKNDIADKEKYISFLAFHDELTGLPNRHGIEQYIQSRIEQGCSSAYMIQMDILGLKIINSTLGYIQGDRLVKIIGDYFSQLKTADLFFSRTSSNEFTLWAENTSNMEIQNLIYDLRQSAKDFLKKNGYGQIVDMQLAVTVYPTQGTNFGELYERTSMAMKVAKDSKTLNLQEYHDDIRLSLESELSMRRYLRKAMKDNEISAYYQAQVDFRTGKTVGVEALARWNSKELGFVPPSVFIPAIDSQNLVTEFSNYMIEKVLKDYDRLKVKYNDEINLSINISPAYFMDIDCYDFLQDAIRNHIVPPEKITLEITEDVFISDPDRINEIINRLHNLGIRISIDDFGTGYSSLNYLTKMNFDEMKIDKSFIDKILEDPKSFQLFEVLCNIARIYGYEIVAEGVETELQLEKIKATSLRIVQGYLFSKPEPL